MRHAINKMLHIGHLSLRCFINSNIINGGHLVDPYNDRVIRKIVPIISYVINSSLKLTYYFKS